MTNEDTIKSLEAKIDNLLEQISVDFNQVNLDSVTLSEAKELNKVFVDEVRNYSIISSTVAPFSLTLISTINNININFLLLSFLFFIINIMFLNISLWFLNSKLEQFFASRLLLNISMATNRYTLLFSKNREERINSVTGFLKDDGELKHKNNIQPHEHKKILTTIRNIGILIFSIALLFLILSVLATNP